MTTTQKVPQAGRLSAWTGYPLLSRKWDATSGIPDLTGKVAIVTGANTGVGYCTTAELLAHNCKVYLACRSEDRAKTAIDDLIKKYPTAKDNAVFLQVDLTDLKSIDKAVQRVLESETRLDIIIGNAGIMAWPYKIQNGVEVQFWNHLGHFALIQPLIPLLIKTAKLPDSHVRIVNVSSYGHKFSPRPDFSSLEAVNRELKSTWERYGLSKLSNILFSKGLQSRLEKENIRCFAVHPGMIHSELLRGQMESNKTLGKIASFLSSKIAMSPAEGAKTQLWAATSPEVDELDLKGEYLTPIAQITTPSADARDHGLADELWRFSEQTIETLRKQ